MSSLALALLLALGWSTPTPAGNDAAALLEGVQQVARPGIPGPIAVFGAKSFAVVEGALGGERRASAIAVGAFGGGRVVAFGHTGYMGADAAGVGDTERLARNLAAWAARSNNKRLRVGAYGGAFGDLFARLGFEVVQVARDAKPAGLDQLALVGCTPLGLSELEAQALEAYVASGGALFCAETPWGWQQLNPTQSLRDRPGQKLLARAGLAFAGGYLEATAPQERFAARAPSELLNAWKALDLLLAQDKNKSAADPARADQASATLQLALPAMPDGDWELRERLADLVRAREAQLRPSAEQPLRREAALARALVAVQHTLIEATPPAKRRAHVSAADFPGAVDATTTVQYVEVDTSQPHWRSTGLYAPPGGRVEVVLPTDAVGQGLWLQVGAHTDELWELDEWRRHPQITTRVELRERQTLVVSAFGGPLYLDVPRGFHLQRVKLQIRGGVPAPRFVLGETTLEQWRGELRARPAPWAELESRKFALTLPASVVRELDDPQALLQFWDRALDAMADVCGLPHERERPERFVCDRQISAGYMHSGYPIMAHLDVAALAVDLARLERGEEIWGFVHELGHNHQREEWTFDGTTEVTCNVLGMYVIDKVCKLPEGKRGHDAVDNPPSIEAYRARGAKFEEWKSDPFLALQMYVQLRDRYGWTPFEKTFAEYLRLGEFERPKNDDEKRDQWLTRLSRNIGRNLGPYFESWGVPTSAKARASLASLPPHE
jgi:hypothetical protein